MEAQVPPNEPRNSHDGARGPRLREIPLRLIVPNLITVLAICSGLTGIRLAFENRYELAVTLVLAAAFIDGIDGRVARMMKATSKFGAQMDSLADIVNFGVAPALVLYVFILDQARSIGWIAALIYAIAAGLRLARFNVMAERDHKAPWQSEYFVGVPAPAGALLVLLPIYLGFLGVQPTAPVAYVALLMSFTWEVLSVTVIAYLFTLPLGARAWHKRFGTLVVMDDVGEGNDSNEAELDRGL